MPKPSKKSEKITLKQLSDQIEALAQATARGFDRVYNEIELFKNDTAESFRRVRNDIFEIKDTYATKKELLGVTVRVEKLEKKK